MAKKEPIRKNKSTGQTGKTYEYNGKIYTLRELTLALGYKYGSVWSRMHNKGLSLEEALTECANNPHTWIGL